MRLVAQAQYLRRQIVPHRRQRAHESRGIRAERRIVAFVEAEVIGLCVAEGLFKRLIFSSVPYMERWCAVTSRVLLWDGSIDHTQKHENPLYPQSSPYAHTREYPFCQFSLL